MYSSSLLKRLVVSVPAGSRAWAGLTHDAVLAQVGGEGQLELPQGLPPVLEQLVLSCLAKEPADRCV
jgi:hypothetical protein